MSAYISIDPELICLQEGHHFAMFGSDSKPLRRSLTCLDCSIKFGRTAVVAYGEESKSFGAWRQMRRHEEELSEPLA